MKSQEEVYESIKANLIETFEIDENDIRPEARLYEDLDLDSIDAVDLVIKLQEITGKKFSPEQFKEIRTVDDMAAVTFKILSE